MSAQTGNVSLDKYGEDDFFSTLLRYGLFASAIFQLICIGISLTSVNDPTDSDTEGAEELKHGNDGMPRRLHKLRKQEKKKRR